ncbi:glutathione S-transferase protein [Teladorsagia circumcincta]|uniref:glutathione transferase n=1 Tax=Teladorsagia circumcincta TaxID=45464 RepID=A0A2G9UGI8_TELCI|nr:glutathione S-transferase protein [Teladorsagia circumcincta]
MVHYRLLYFDGRGRAEVARQLFALANQEYVDVRITHEEWPKHKPEMPFGQLPVLDVDGKLLGQSHAINRYLARQFGFAGKSPFEEALVDAFADQYRDFYTEAQPYLYAVWGFVKGDVVSRSLFYSRML